MNYRIFFKLKDLRICPADIKVYKVFDTGRTGPKYINIWLTTSIDFSEPDFIIMYSPQNDEVELFIKDTKILDDYFKVEDTPKIKL